jgi:hypothetical protein
MVGRLVVRRVTATGFATAAMQLVQDESELHIA